MQACEKLSLPIVIPRPSAPKSLQTAFRCNPSKNMKQIEIYQDHRGPFDKWLLLRSMGGLQEMGIVYCILKSATLLVKMGKIFYDSEIFFASICQGKYQENNREKN